MAASPRFALRMRERRKGPSPPVCPREQVLWLSPEGAPRAPVGRPASPCGPCSGEDSPALRGRCTPGHVHTQRDPAQRGQAPEVFLRGGEDGRRRAAGARCRRTKARKALSQAAASPCPSGCPGLPVATVPVYLASPFSDGQRMESRCLLGLAGMRLRGARGFSAAATASVPSG